MSKVQIKKCWEETLMNVAESSDMNFKHACIMLQGKTIISVGCNTKISEMCSCHAEVACVMKGKGGQ